jgi:hypothetical protein
VANVRAPRILKFDLFLLLHFANAVFAGLLFVTGIELGHWPFAVFGVISLCGLIFRFGWFVPTTVAGIYLGAFVLQPIAMTGSIESQLRESVTRTIACAVAGLVVGRLLDHSRKTSLQHQRISDSQSDTS